MRVSRLYLDQPTMLDETSVSGWIQQVKAGDKGQPVQRLWERYFQRLVRLARATLGMLPRRVVDEEDLALSAFASFCNGAERGNFPRVNSRYDLWRLLVIITARKSYQLKRSTCRQKRGGSLVLDAAGLTRWENNVTAVVDLEQVIATEPTPEFAAQAVDEYRHLLKRLGDDRLRVVAQWKMEGFTNKEIAAKLGCAPRTVERRLLLIRSLWSAIEECEEKQQ
jgi:DNA-directed RNA polymerase specialized sigma24 family protein